MLLLVTLIVMMPAAAEELKTSEGFNQYESYKLGKDPIDLSPIDYDGDGDTDLVGICNGDIMTNVSRIVYLKNEGQGNFTVEKEDRQKKPYMLETEDMDQDGDRDIILLEEGADYSTDLKILLNNQDGTFETRDIDSYSGMFFENIQTVELNDDGRPDIAINSGISTSVYLTDSQMSFTKKDLDLNGTSAVSFTDVDGDGHTDIFKTENGMKAMGEVTTQPNIGYYRNLGNGSFEQIVHMIPDFLTRDITTAEINGEMMVFLSHLENSKITKYRWTGSELEKVSTFDPGKHTARQIEIEDIDADGKKDLAALSVSEFGTSSAKVTVYTNLTSGLDKMTDISLSMKTSEFTPIDLDGDGFKDLVSWEESEMISAGNKALVSMHDVKTVETDDTDESGDGGTGDDGSGDPMIINEDVAGIPIWALIAAAAGGVIALASIIYWTRTEQTPEKKRY